ncbi:MAG: hypothetical protein RLZZ292_3504 [Bacteroidota bacterium]
MINQNSFSLITVLSNFFSKKTISSKSLNPNYDSQDFYIIGRDKELSRHTENILRRIVAETGAKSKIHIQY